jgi:predicted RNA binding protein YcfA (HicA-like mRNA interferase family)
LEKTGGGVLTNSTKYGTIEGSDVMGQKEKLLERLRNNPTNVRFEDLDRLLQWHGFERRSPRGGSHYFYKRKGCRPISIPRHKPVKSVYVKKAVALIDELGEPTEE